MSKVYVCNYSGHNIHAAEKYGDIVILTKGKINPFNTDRLGSELAEKLKNFTEDDFLLLSGTPILVFMAALISAEKTGTSVSVLIWNAKTGEYEARRIFLNNISVWLRREVLTNEVDG